MSYSYGSPFTPTSYSNHSTPPSAFQWNDVEQQQQHQHELQPQVVAASMHHHQPSISPESYQQQLSPVEPALTLEQHQQHQQHQSPPPPAVPAYTPPRTIELQERAHQHTSQLRFDIIDESHFLHQESTETRRRSSSKAPSRPAGDEMQSSTRPSSTGAGPSRVPHGKTQREQSHPYRLTPIGSTFGTSSTRNAGVRSASSSARAQQPQQQQQRDVEVLGERTSHASSHVPSSAVGSRLAVQCPAIHTWRVPVNPLPTVEMGEQPVVQRVVSGETTAGSVTVTSNDPQDDDPTSPTAQQPVPTPGPELAVAPVPRTQLAQQQHQLRQMMIRADVGFNPSSNEMTAVLELPGIKKQDLVIYMTVCPYTQVRQLTIKGRNRPLLPPTVYSVQERKYGDFLRTVVVPLDTKLEDIVAKMEDGVLILKVSCRSPAEREDAQEVPIQ